jgi:uncharacterized membrane protein
MTTPIGRHTRLLSLRHLAGIVLVSMATVAGSVNALADRPYFSAIIHNYYIAGLFIFCVCAFFIGVCILMSSCLGNGTGGISQAIAILVTTQGIFLWPRADALVSFAIPGLIILLEACALILIFRSKSPFDDLVLLKEKKYIFMLAIVYALALYLLALRSLHTLSFFNSKDFAIYNQTFWNTVHGRLFQNSTYGSNLACHNTWFFLLLVPFYYFFPSPETLIGLKIAFVALAAIPYYLIIKDILYRPCRLVMMIVFFFYPFLIAQAFTPPHEIGFAPAVILCAYYFFRRNSLCLFIISLIIMLSIKEHLAMVALAFGVFAFFSKKGLRWTVLPIALGILWAVISYEIIVHFQKVYRSHADASWFLTSFKHVLHHDANTSLHLVLERANISSWFRVKPAFLLFAPLGFVVPLMSWTCLLGLPEFALNLLADRPSMFTPQWHYNIAVSVFLLIACAEGIRKISRIRLAALTAGQIQLALSIIILSLTLIHSYTWLPLIRIRTETQVVASLRRSLTHVPRDAFVTVPQRLAIAVSDRLKYSLLETGVLGDYVVTDEPHCLVPLSPADGYQLIYREDDVCLYKRINYRR